MLLIYEAKTLTKLCLGRPNMNMINSHECPPTLRDCIFKVLPTLELPKKDSFFNSKSSVPQKNKCGTKKGSH